MTMDASPPPSDHGAAEADTLICSAHGCRAVAHFSVVWNNPKIHTPDREKVWTACDDHRDHLADYLRRHRMNLIRIETMGG
jgi:hypothetical protein